MFVFLEKKPLPVKNISYICCQMKRINIPYIAYFAADQAKLYPVAFVPKVHFDLLRADSVQLYSAVHQACGQIGHRSKLFKAQLSVKPMYYYDGHYYQNVANLQPNEVKAALGDTLTVAFFFPETTPQTIVKNIIQKFNLQSHQK